MAPSPAAWSTSPGVTSATAKKSADAQYKLDKEACATLSGNTKDICMAEAKGKDTAAKADAEAAYLEAKERAGAHLRDAFAPSAPQ